MNTLKPTNSRSIIKGIGNMFGRDYTLKNITNLQKTLVKYMETNNIDNGLKLYYWSIDTTNNVPIDWSFLIRIADTELKLPYPLGTAETPPNSLETTDDRIKTRILHLSWCIKKGYTIMATYLINKIYRPDTSYYTSTTFKTPINDAINTRNMELIKDMLDKGTDPNVIGICEEPVLICMLNEELSIVNRRLLDNSIPIDNYFTEIIKLLLVNGADPNIKGHMGKTPLMIASEARNVEIVKLLIVKGADPNITDNSGLSSIDIAKTTEHIEIIRLLNPISIATKEIVEDLRFKNNAIPIKISKVANEGEKLTNKSAIQVIGNKDLSKLISKYGGKSKKHTTKKTRRKKSTYKRKSKKRYSKSK